MHILIQLVIHLLEKQTILIIMNIVTIVANVVDVAVAVDIVLNIVVLHLL